VRDEDDGGAAQAPRSITAPSSRRRGPERARSARQQQDFWTANSVRPPRSFGDGEVEVADFVVEIDMVEADGVKMLGHQPRRMLAPAPPRSRLIGA